MQPPSQPEPWREPLTGPVEDTGGPMPVIRPDGIGPAGSGSTGAGPTGAPGGAAGGAAGASHPIPQDSPHWQPPLPGAAHSGAAHSGAASSSELATRAHLPVPATSSTPASRSLNGLFSDVRREGRWEVPAQLTMAQAMSDVQLDFRDAVVAHSVIDVQLYTAMATVKIIVPPGVGVETTDGTSIMSDEKGELNVLSAPGGYTLRIAHHALMSSLKVITLAPGESEPKWWKRKKK